MLQALKAGVSGRPELGGTMTAVSLTELEKGAELAQEPEAALLRENPELQWLPAWVERNAMEPADGKVRVENFAGKGMLQPGPLKRGPLRFSGIRPSDGLNCKLD